MNAQQTVVAVMVLVLRPSRSDGLTRLKHTNESDELIDRAVKQTDGRGSEHRLAGM